MMSQFGGKVCITFQPLLVCPFWIKQIVGGLGIVTKVLVICGMSLLCLRRSRMMMIMVVVVVAFTANNFDTQWSLWRLLI